MRQSVPLTSRPRPGGVPEPREQPVRNARTVPPCRSSGVHSAERRRSAMRTFQSFAFPYRRSVSAGHTLETHCIDRSRKRRARDDYIAKSCPGRWRLARQIRLEALAASPDAFGSTLSEARRKDAQDWRNWLTVSGRGVTFAAAKSDTPSDICGVARAGPEDGDAGLFSLWVREDARGHGIGERLVGSAMAWARDHGHARLVLDVYIHNAAAGRLYRRIGFERIGQTGDADALEDRYAIAVGPSRNP